MGKILKKKLLMKIKHLTTGLNEMTKNIQPFIWSQNTFSSYQLSVGENENQ